MIRHTDIQLIGSSGRPFLIDLLLPGEQPPRANLIFCHGFKGFKDWGHWDMIAAEFIKLGFAFIKFNFSHNGTTIKNPLDFEDLEAFGQNNFSKELQDLNIVLNQTAEWTKGGKYPLSDKEILIGHSRGGPICLLAAVKSPHVVGAVTWASVPCLEYAWTDDSALKLWREKGVSYIFNGRTKQEMPLYYQLFEDFKLHEAEFDIGSNMSKSQLPFCFIHGSNDPAVPSKAARSLYEMSNNAEMHLIDGADHVFGGYHPYLNADLPRHSQELVKISGDFINRILD